MLNRSFRDATIKTIVEHFQLPERTILTMGEFVLDDEFTFLSSIKQNYQHGPFKLIEELVLLSVSSGGYDARSHYLIIEVAESLGIPRDLVEIHCESVYDLLLNAQNNEIESKHDPQVDKDRERRDTRKKIKKYVMIGLASLGGGAVIGVTGGLAAPIVASAFAGVIGAGSIVMSSAAAGIVGSLFGVAGAGLTASKMNKRIGDLEEFAFESLNSEHDQTSLTITIAISGWITDESPQQFSKQWKYLRHTKEQYCLCYESKYLLELSRAMDYLLSFVVSYATQEALKYTFLASVMAAIAWPTALISIANIIDNPWDCCLGRSAQAGKHLADVLMSRQQGKRPASLIGFSLGARVIFFCLQELAERNGSEGMIGDVVLLGAPVTASIDNWKPLGRVVSGRIINGYSSSDWLLKFLYRTSSAAIRVAGLQEIRWDDRRLKNVDLTHLVSGHMDYYKKLTEILDYVNIRTVRVNFEDDLLISSTPATIPESPSSDSGIGRTIFNSTNMSNSNSLSQQSLNREVTFSTAESAISLHHNLDEVEEATASAITTTTTTTTATTAPEGMELKNMEVKQQRASGLSNRHPLSGRRTTTTTTNNTSRLALEGESNQRQLQSALSALELTAGSGSYRCRTSLGLMARKRMLLAAADLRRAATSNALSLSALSRERRQFRARSRSV